MEALRFPSSPVPSDDQHCDVAIVGGGPVGLSAAIDLAQRGVRSVLIDDDNRLADGSRAICWSRRTLEIFSRLGIGIPLREHGVQWFDGRTFHRDRELFKIRLTPDTFPENPFFVNFQQSLVEHLLVERVAELDGLVDMRWGHRLAGLNAGADGAALEVSAKGRQYRLHARYVIAADGARSAARDMLGLDWAGGQEFDDRFLITDILMRGDFPTERRFWFDPPFHEGRSTLLHKQPFDIWRIDFQLPADADPETEKQPAKVLPRVRAFLGEDVDFETVWCSVYRFQCRRLERFRKGCVFLAGDAAHVVSPFGARGGNAGIQDADNLCWKIAQVLVGGGHPRLLDTYEEERIPATDENILASRGATDFMSPKSRASLAFRDAALDLSVRHPFARRLINSGRMSVPARLGFSSLSKLGPPPPADAAVLPGDAALDVPLRASSGKETYLLRELGGCWSVVAVGAEHAGQLAVIDERIKRKLAVCEDGNEVRAPWQALSDPGGLVRERYCENRAALIVFRPDDHVLGVWDAGDTTGVRSALDDVMSGSFASGGKKLHGH